MTLRQGLIYFTMVSLPLQIFALRIGGTQIDLAVIGLLSLGLVEATFGKAKLSFWGVVLLFFAANFFASVYFGTFSGLRYISAATVLLICLLLLMTRSSLPNVDLKLIWKIISVSVVVTSLVILIQKFAFSASRPHALFQEPSGAGLFLFGFLAAEFVRYSLFGEALKLKNGLMLGFVAAAALVTRSTQVVAFVVCLTLVFAAAGKITPKRLLLTTFCILSVFIVVLYTPHLQERMRFSGELNLSQLAWLQGMDQAITTLKSSPVVGFGFGSTGMFGFESRYAQLLIDIGFEGLNQKDAFSGLFRLVIECGIMGLVFVVFIARRSLRQFKQTFRNRKIGAKFRIEGQLIVFSMVVFFGILLKEPVWTRSFVAACIVPLYLVRFET